MVVIIIKLINFFQEIHTKFYYKVFRFFWPMNRFYIYYQSELIGAILATTIASSKG